MFSLNAFSFLWIRANSISAPLSQSDKWKCRDHKHERRSSKLQKYKFWITKNTAQDIFALLTPSDKWKCRPQAREKIVKLQKYQILKYKKYRARYFCSSVSHWKMKMQTRSTRRRSSKIAKLQKWKIQKNIAQDISVLLSPKAKWKCRPKA